MSLPDGSQRRLSQVLSRIFFVSEARYDSFFSGSVESSSVCLLFCVLKWPFSVIICEKTAQTRESVSEPSKSFRLNRESVKNRFKRLSHSWIALRLLWFTEQKDATVLLSCFGRLIFVSWLNRTLSQYYYNTFVICWNISHYSWQ